MKQYEFHPIAKVFPLDNDGPDFDAFVEDIKVNKLQQPIVLHKGKILDGRRRYLACQQTGEERDTCGLEPKGIATEFRSVRQHPSAAPDPKPTSGGAWELLEEEENPRRKSVNDYRTAMAKKRSGRVSL